MAGKAARKNSIVVCPCGVRIVTDPKGSTTREVCAACGISLRVEWGRDGRQRPVPLVVYASREGAASRTPPARASRPASVRPSPSAGASAPTRPATPPPQPAVTDFRCECGTMLQVGIEYAGLRVACPDCGAEIAIERARDPQTFVTVLRKVVKKPGTTRPAAARDTDTRGGMDPDTETLSCVCGRTLLVRRDDIGKQAECHGCGRQMKLEAVRDPQSLRVSIRAVNLDPDTSQELICSCGAAMMVYPDDLGKQIQCSRCGTQMRVKKVWDAETKTSALQVKVIGADDALKDLHDEDWSLDDFK